MSDTSLPRHTLRVTTCDTDETLAAASGLFNQYRHHALGLYRRLGFRLVEGLTSLSLDLAPHAIKE